MDAPLTCRLSLLIVGQGIMFYVINMLVAYTTWPTLTLMFVVLTQPGLPSSTPDHQSSLELYPCLIDLFAVPTGRVLGPSREALNILSSACQDAVPTGRIRVPSRKEVYVLPDVVASGRD